MNPTQPPSSNDPEPQQEIQPPVIQPMTSMPTTPNVSGVAYARTRWVIPNPVYKIIGILLCALFLLMGINNVQGFQNDQRIYGSFTAGGCGIYYHGVHGGYDYRCGGTFTPADSRIQPTDFPATNYVTASKDITGTTLSAFELIPPHQVTGIRGDQIFFSGSLTSSPVYWIVIVIASGLIGLFLVYSLISRYLKNR